MSVAPSSIDMVRVIRRSMRCLVFGAAGLTPLFGTGLAVQALRLNRAVQGELGEPWSPPGLPLWWIGGLLVVGVSDRAWGGLGSAPTCCLLLLLQCWHIRWSYVPDRSPVWNPGWPHLIWGVVLACAGLSSTFWLLAILAVRVSQGLASA